MGGEGCIIDVESGFVYNILADSKKYGSKANSYPEGTAFLSVIEDSSKRHLEVADATYIVDFDGIVYKIPDKIFKQIVNKIYSRID